MWSSLFLSLYLSLSLSLSLSSSASCFRFWVSILPVACLRIYCGTFGFIFYIKDMFIVF